MPSDGEIYQSISELNPEHANYTREAYRQLSYLMSQMLKREEESRKEFRRKMDNRKEGAVIKFRPYKHKDKTTYPVMSTVESIKACINE